jgi:2-phosphosulfolactate phosphatase
MANWSLDHAHQQQASRLRFEWGIAGAMAIAQGADIAVVVDVLSFTTTLSVALDAGTEVLPYRWKDESAIAFAQENDAVLAVSRDKAGPGDISLSAQTIRTAPPTPRLVLPSPNGSTISRQLAAVVPTVLGASLRNAGAVAEWLGNHFDRESTTVAVIAAGEHWPDGALRPAVEDIWGAGAVLSALHRLDWTGFSPEARFAAQAFDCIAGDTGDQLRACASGQELIDNGYAGDVEVAAEVEQSRSVPILRGNRFVRASDE